METSIPGSVNKVPGMVRLMLELATPALSPFVPPTPPALEAADALTAEPLGPITASVTGLASQVNLLMIWDLAENARPVRIIVKQMVLCMDIVWICKKL